MLLFLFFSVFAPRFFLLFLYLSSETAFITPLLPHCQNWNHRSRYLIQLSILLSSMQHNNNSEPALPLYPHVPLIASACPFYWVISTVMHCDIYLWGRMLCSARCGQLCQQGQKQGFVILGAKWEICPHVGSLVTLLKLFAIDFHYQDRMDELLPTVCVSGRASGWDWIKGVIVLKRHLAGAEGGWWVDITLDFNIGDHYWSKAKASSQLGQLA